jgi:LacI family transcriptional regulator
LEQFDVYLEVVLCVLMAPAEVKDPLPLGRKPGDRALRPSIRQVAQRAGVAMSSVSRVLSGHAPVSQAMRERVLQAVEELDYEPDFLARGVTKTVGFSLSDIANPVIAENARGAEEVLRAAGYSMLVMSSEHDPSLEAAHIRTLQSRRVDGLIVSVSSEREPGTIESLANASIPVVVVDRHLPERVRASVVLSNHRTGMAEAVGRLLDMGHRRIALLTWPLELRPGRERLAGLQQAYAARALSDTSLPTTGLLTAAQAEAAMDTILDDVWPPTAIVAGANQLLIGCLQALQRRGLRAGVDLALVTCDDVPLAALHTPPIAAIARDNMRIGRLAAELLLHRMHGREEPEVVTVETSFILRASCSPPAQVA